MGRAIGKNEEEVAAAMMSQIKERCNPVEPPAIVSDGNDSYSEAILETGGNCRSTLVGVDLQHASNRNLDGNAFKSQNIGLGVESSGSLTEWFKEISEKCRISWPLIPPTSRGQT